jgi:hypothetical protein
VRDGERERGEREGERELNHSSPESSVDVFNGNFK